MSELTYGAGYVSRTADAGYVAVPQGGAYVVELPAEVQRAFASGEAREEREARERMANAADLAQAMVRTGRWQPKTIAEVFSAAERTANAADREEARRRDALLLAAGDPAEAFTAPRSAPPPTDPVVKRYRASQSDPFMQRMITEYDERVTRRAQEELRRMRYQAEARVAKLDAS